MKKNIAFNRGITLILTAIASGRDMKGVDGLIESDMSYLKQMMVLNGMECPEYIDRMTRFRTIPKNERAELAREALRW